jgi:hypothetical protein
MAGLLFRRASPGGTPPRRKTEPRQDSSVRTTLNNGWDQSTAGTLEAPHPVGLNLLSFSHCHLVEFTNASEGSGNRCGGISRVSVV